MRNNFSPENFGFIGDFDCLGYSIIKHQTNYSVYLLAAFVLCWFSVRFGETNKAIKLVDISGYALSYKRLH